MTPSPLNERSRRGKATSQVALRRAPRARIVSTYKVSTGRPAGDRRRGHVVTVQRSRGCPSGGGLQHRGGATATARVIVGGRSRYDDTNPAAAWHTRDNQQHAVGQTHIRVRDAALQRGSLRLYPPHVAIGKSNQGSSTHAPLALENPRDRTDASISSCIVLKQPEGSMEGPARGRGSIRQYWTRGAYSIV